MKIGILVPLPQELTSLTRSKVEPGTCFSLAENITVCLSGVGRKQTRSGFGKLLKNPVDLVISWGSAAGLTSAVAAGDLLIPEFIKVGNSMIATSREFNHRLISYLPENLTHNQEPIAECKAILSTVEDKRNLHAATQCVAADMESGALAQLAEQQKIPFSVVRSVVDEADMPLPNSLLKSIGKGAFDLPVFLGWASLNPSEWPMIAKLMANFNKAKKTLIIASDIIKINSNTWM